MQPSYTEDGRTYGHDGKGNRVCTGSMMGRCNRRGDPDCNSRFYLRRVRINSGGYDQGGAYWGLGLPLYWYSALPDDGEISGYVRAWSREDAKEMVRDEYPNARFFA